ncbi:MAG: helicase C-terminal domain-containing protein [Candidatus Hodarchaeales archaeon]
MITPISKLIIHPSVRPQQQRTYDIIQENWNQYHSFFCSLPTGSGKTDLAACLLSEYLKTNKNAKVDILVPYKMHQDFWQNILEIYGRKHGFSVALLKGRSSYYCPIIKSGANVSPCAFDSQYARTCKFRQRCSLLKARRRARKSQVRILNWWVYKFVDLGEDEASFRIFDECHNLLNLESLVRFEIEQSFLEKYINDRELLNKFKSWETNKLQSKKYVNIEQKEGISFVRRLQSALIDREQKIASELNTNPDNIDTNMLRELKRVSEMTDTLSRLTEKPESSDLQFFFQHSRKQNKTKLVIQPFDIAYIFSDIFKSGKNLFLSATIGDGEYLAKLLGFDTDHCFFIHESSSFDKNAHPFITLQDAMRLSTANQEKKTQTFKYIRDKMAPILKIMREQKLRGLILTSSFEIASITSKLAKDLHLSVVTHTAGRSDEAIKDFTLAMKGDVLITPSAWEGISLDDDLGRVCIIPKLPFPMMGDPIIRKKMQKYPKFMENEVLISIQQAHGRIQRNPSDWGVTICLDGNIKWLTSKKNKSLEPWFLERMHKYTLEEVKDLILNLTKKQQSIKPSNLTKRTPTQATNKSLSRMKKQDREWLESSGLIDLLKK